ncbi:caspase family protein [uncultured Desulfobacter sp.]|uniref:caspase family protein n=1 Tax=uncultured Desulfobacter sp. TaxID=240139 RepID=UPI002AA95F5A|nr:caspase family protein [uncultured Desulfobacter sp.]
MTLFSSKPKPIRFKGCRCLAVLLILMFLAGCVAAGPATSSSPGISSSDNSRAIVRKEKHAAPPASATDSKPNQAATSEPVAPPDSNSSNSGSSNAGSHQLSIPRDKIVLLFHREDENAPSRKEAVSQDTARALENTLLGRGYKILPIPPDVQRKLDRARNKNILCFAPDAGLSMTYSIYKNRRPDPGVNIYAAEVSIRARIFVGAGLLATEKGRGVVRFKDTGKEGGYGERRAMEVAADRAAKILVKRIDARLKSLSDEELMVYVEPLPDPVTPVPPPSGSLPLPTSGNTHVLIVGVSDYSNVSRVSQQHVNNLNGVNKDLKNIEQTFMALNIPKNRIKVLKNQRATAANVRAAITAMSRAAGPDDLLILYIAGHGMQAPEKKEGMSIPIFYDFNLQATASAPDFSELLDLVSGQSAANRFIMIADTCHSGGAASILPTVVVTSRGVRLSKAAGSPSPGIILREINMSRDIAVLSSAGYEEVAWEHQGTGGLFTYYLAKGLRNAGPKEVLREIVENRVAGPVIRESKKMCSSATCPTGQQTPTLGFSGHGDMIQLIKN